MQKQNEIDTDVLNDKQKLLEILAKYKNRETEHMKIYHRTVSPQENTGQMNIAWNAPL